MYLFEVCMSWNLHQFYLLLFSLCHERLLDVFCAALLQGHRHYLRTTNEVSVKPVMRCFLIRRSLGNHVFGHHWEHVPQKWLFLSADRQSIRSDLNWWNDVEVWLVEGWASLTLSTLLSVYQTFFFIYVVLLRLTWDLYRSVLFGQTPQSHYEQDKILYGPVVEGAGCGSSSQTGCTVGLCFYRASWWHSCISPSLQPPPMPNPPLTGNVQWAVGEHVREWDHL